MNTYIYFKKIGALVMYININFFIGKNNIEVIVVKKYIINKILFALLVFFTIMGLVSCSSQRKPSTKESQQQTEEKDVPKELEEFKKSLDKSEKTLLSIHEEKKKMKQNTIKEDKKSGESSQLQIQMKPDELSEYDKQQKEIQAKEEKLKKENETLEKFDKLKKDVIELHSLWNTAEPKVIASLAPQKSISDFKNALNSFTDTIQIPDEFLNLLAINELYKFLPDFYELYNAKEPPDLDRLRYGIKKIKLVSEKDDFNTAKITLEYLINAWNNAKPKFKKDSMTSINKFELGLNDLKKSIENQNKTLVEVKSEVLIKIIDEIGKASKKD